MQIKVLQYIFYVLMCLPILALGVYFFVHLVKDIRDISRDEKRAKQAKELELNKRRVFEEVYNKRRNG